MQKKIKLWQNCYISLMFKNCFCVSGVRAVCKVLYIVSALHFAIKQNMWKLLFHNLFNPCIKSASVKAKNNLFRSDSLRKMGQLNTVCFWCSRSYDVQTYQLLVAIKLSCYHVIFYRAPHIWALNMSCDWRPVQCLALPCSWEEPSTWCLCSI